MKDRRGFGPNSTQTAQAIQERTKLPKKPGMLERLKVPPQASPIKLPNTAPSAAPGPRP